MTYTICKIKIYTVSLCISLFSLTIKSQDLEPRFLSSMPMGTNFAAGIYGYSTGNVLLNALEIENFNAKLNNAAFVYGHSFNFLNKPAKFDIVAAYTFGDLNALVSGIDTTVYKEGFSDPTFRISLILIGEEVLSIKEFAKREKKKFKLGAAFKIQAPLGKYDETKLINFGSNRWGFQIKAAASYWFLKKLIFELHVDSWFFTTNKSYFNGDTLNQKPLITTQLHVAYLFNPKFWISASIGQVAYGETLINNIEQENNQKNSKYGITASYLISKQGSFKLSVTNGLYTASGVNFRTYLFGYSILWFDKNKTY